MPSARVAQKILAAEVTELIHGSEQLLSLKRQSIAECGRADEFRISLAAAQGLKQALAATDLFFGDDLAALDTPALAAALDGTATPGQPDIPAMIVDLTREQVIGQPLERFLIASTLVESKSEYLLLSASVWRRGGHGWTDADSSELCVCSASAQSDRGGHDHAQRGQD